jgi:hypothetical protein
MEYCLSTIDSSVCLVIINQSWFLVPKYFSYVFKHESPEFASLSMLIMCSWLLDSTLLTLRPGLSPICVKHLQVSGICTPFLVKSKYRKSPWKWSTVPLNLRTRHHLPSRLYPIFVYTQLDIVGYIPLCTSKLATRAPYLPVYLPIFQHWFPYLTPMMFVGLYQRGHPPVLSWFINLINHSNSSQYHKS